MLLTECGLVLIAVIVTFTFPEAGSHWFRTLERGFAKLARRRGLAVVVVGIAALALRAAVLPIEPIPQPAVHDDFSYLLMADTFAHGRVTNPTHPMWVHFESVTVIHKPTYCSVFYPAQGLFLALGQAIAGHPFWGLWLSVGLMCAAICWMLQGWLPSVWALLGGLLAVIRLGVFSYWTNSYFGGAVAAAGGALVLGALPRIKRHQRVGDALLMGLGLALLANSRPFEGLFFSLPIGLALLIWMLRKNGQALRQSLRRVMLPLGLVLAVTACCMLYYFWRTTGSPFRPPYFVNLETYFVDPGFPWLPVKPMPKYHHQVIQNLYLGWALSQYQFARLHPIFAAVIKVDMLWFFFFGPLLTLPFLMLSLVLPYGMSYKDLRPKTRFLLLVCCVSLLGLLLPAYANAHYAAPLTAAMYALIMIALQRIRHWRWHRKPAGLAIVRAVPLIALALLLLRVALPIFHLEILNGSIPETWCSPWNQLVERARIAAQLEGYPGQHLALVHYSPQHDPKEGWVNNAADIDDSKVIWAHDMGQAENEELISYFKKRQVWLVEPDEYPARISPYPVNPPSQPTAGENTASPGGQ